MTLLLDVFQELVEHMAFSSGDAKLQCVRIVITAIIADTLNPWICMVGAVMARDRPCVGGGMPLALLREVISVDWSLSCNTLA